MKEQINHLVSLQTIDDEVLVVERELGIHQTKLDKLNQDIAILRDQMEAKQQDRKEIAARQRELDLEIDDTQRLSKKSQDRLSSIKNAREYKALQREIDDSKRRIVQCEEELVGWMEKAEVLDAEIAKFAEEIQALEDTFSQDKEEAEKVAKSGQAKLKKLNNSRQKVAKNVDKALFKRYELILKNRNGMAVAPVTNAVCLGCNMNVPPQVYNELQQGEQLKACPHCERIIYYKCEPEPEE